MYLIFNPWPYRFFESLPDFMAKFNIGGFVINFAMVKIESAEVIAIIVLNIARIMIDVCFSHTAKIPAHNEAVYLFLEYQH